MVFGPAATNGLDRDDLGLEVLLSPCPHARGNHVSRIDARTGASDTARAASDAKSSTHQAAESKRDARAAFNLSRARDAALTPQSHSGRSGKSRSRP
jgi:hypothetical protein